MSEPRRVLIDWDYGASGIWRCRTREEMDAPAPQGGRWSGKPPANLDTLRLRPWSDLLSEPLLDALKSWNISCESADRNGDRDQAIIEDEGRDLALLVQKELGVGNWEVLYVYQRRVHRVDPIGSWPIETWKQDLLGYAPPGPMR
ncbi:MAG: hypothetical protein M0T78_01915 [Actinomycetota bacterium]|nr:hypothetical protein [Actinomycetota bacterium]